MSNGLVYHTWDAAVIGVVVGALIIERLGKTHNFAVEATAADHIAAPSANGFVVEDRVDCQRPQVRGPASLRIHLVQNGGGYAHRDIVIVKHGAEAIIQLVATSGFDTPSLILVLPGAPRRNCEPSAALEGKMVHAPPVMRHIAAPIIAVVPILVLGRQRGASYFFA